MYRAIQVTEFGSPSVLKMAQVKNLKIKAEEVLVNMHAAGINPVETYIRAGTHKLKPQLPYTPGNDGAGIVEQVGPNVQGLKKGDRVYISKSISGTYAEKAVCHHQYVHPLPDNVSFLEGAAISTPYLTAYRALIQRGGAVTGENVLIHGASGGVGIAALQFCKLFGLNAIGTASSARGKALVLEQGAIACLDHSSDGYLDSIPELTQGKGIHLIVEMLSNMNLGKDLKLLAKNGRVAIVGSRGSTEIDPRDTMNVESDIRGVYLPLASPSELKDAHSVIFQGLQGGHLSPIVGKTFPLNQADQGHLFVMQPGAQGKTILDCFSN